MSRRSKLKIIAVAFAGCATLSLVPLFFRLPILQKEAATGVAERFVPDPAIGGMPIGWKLEPKPGTRPSVFSVESVGDKGLSFLHMESDSSSASLITRAGEVDLRKTPVLRWRWRAITLPAGADGRVRAKDDQAIGIYVGAGSVLNNKSVSYRWDTETPKDAEGNCTYGMGTIKVRWRTLRNKADAARGEWFVEERNVAEDFKKAWGFCPDKIYLSVSCNSQYTKSRAAADLAWIEFVPLKELGR